MIITSTLTLLKALALSMASELFPIAAPTLNLPFESLHAFG